jgi:hypothetical protein
MLNNVKRVCGLLGALFVFIPSAAPAAEIDEALAIFKGLQSKASRNPKVLSDCFGYPTNPPPGSTRDNCSVADAPGDGLVCPTGDVAHAPEAKCDAYKELTTEAKLSAASSALIEYESKLKIVLHIFFLDEATKDHVHVPASTYKLCSKCSDTYIKNQTQYQVAYAAYQENDETVQVNLPAGMSGIQSWVQNLTVKIKKGKGIAASQGPIYFCQRYPHSGDTKCNECTH